MASRIISGIRSTTLRPLWAGYIGYTLWLMMGAELVTTRTMVVPVTVHAASAGTIAPTHIMISLRGSRALLSTLSTAHLAAHVTVHNYEPGFQHISLTERELLLPPGVSLVNYVEIPILVSKT